MTHKLEHPNESSSSSTVFIKLTLPIAPNSTIPLKNRSLSKHDNLLELPIFDGYSENKIYFLAYPVDSHTH